MADLFYLPYYIDDYEAATAHLTPEEDGIYMRLIRLCWRTPGCTIPNDINWIARKMRIPNNQDKIQKIIDEYFTLKNGRLFQKRLLEIYSSKIKTSKARKRAGSRGGITKALKYKEKLSNKTIDLLKQNSSNTQVVKAKAKAKKKEVYTAFYKSKKGKILNGKCFEGFMAFWKPFAYPKGKAEAADVWYLLWPLDESELNMIISAASKTAQERKQQMEQGQTPKMAQGWLSGRRWEDFEIMENEEAKRMEYYKKYGKWHENWGPKPTPKEQKEPICTNHTDRS